MGNYLFTGGFTMFVPFLVVLLVFLYCSFLVLRKPNHEDKAQSLIKKVSKPAYKSAVPQKPPLVDIQSQSSFKFLMSMHENLDAKVIQSENRKITYAHGLTHEEEQNLAELERQLIEDEEDGVKNYSPDTDSIEDENDFSDLDLNIDLTNSHRPKG